MKKSITKKATSSKRPKSVLRKAWETRRKNEKHRASLEGQMNKVFFGDNADTSKLPGLASLSQATKTLGTETPRSENAATVGGVNAAFDAVARTIEMHRDEMLLGFMGDMSAMRSTNGRTGHHPIMLSKAQANAIEEFLSLHGYSAWGKAEIKATTPAPF